METTQHSDIHTGAMTASTRGLRFCMITTFYPPYNFGGDGIFVQRLARALVKAGHQVTVIHCVDAYQMSSSGAAADETKADPGIEVHALKSAAGILSPLITHQLAIPGLKGAEIRRILQESDFDVVHFHNISLVGGPALMSFDCGRAIKLYTAHEFWLLCPLSTLWKFQEAPCETRSCIRCTINAGRPPQLWRYSNVLEKSLQQLDALIAPSRFMIHQHQSMGIQEEFVHLPNFLPLEEKPATAVAGRSRGGAERPFFLVAGRLEKSKGVQRAIAAFKNIPNADLVIVGTGQYEAELKSLASGYGNIIFTGHIPYEQLVAHYTEAVAVIVPSLWYEPFGLIVIEAFAQHTPVIVNNAGALPELVEDSDGGIVYNDNEGLEGAVQRLLDDSSLRNQLGENGHNAYLQNWTEQHHLKGYLALVGDLQKR